MPRPRSSSSKRDREFKKREREKLKREKAALKREKRKLGAQDAAATVVDDAPDDGPTIRPENTPAVSSDPTYEQESEADQDSETTGSN